MEPNKSCATKKSRKRSIAPDSSEDATVMDEHIWKQVPEDLLEIVIARLPIASFCRFRSVCQKWNSLLHSQSFSQRWSEVAQKNQPWLYATTCRSKTTMHDPCMNKWYHCNNISSNLRPLASVGGLVCCDDHMSKCLYIGNPLTQTWKQLPWYPTANIFFPWYITSIMGMVQNQDYSRGFKLVFVNTRGKYEVYDSLENTSSPSTNNRVRSVPEEITLPVIHGRNNTKVVSIGNVVYFLRTNPDGIVSYDVVSGAWEQFLIPTQPNRNHSLTLAECGGRILLMGLGEENEEMFVRVWELDQSTMLAWKEIDRMPSSWCSEFRGRTYLRLSCLGNGGLLMMLERTKWMNRVFTYDVMNRKWSKVHTSNRQSIKEGVVFFPSLFASP